jgi:hypothetical protein
VAFAVEACTGWRYAIEGLTAAKSADVIASRPQATALLRRAR